MIKFYIFIFILIFPLIALGQSTKLPKKAELTNIYSLAISDFIKDTKIRNLKAFDTLFIGKRKSGQPDDFPNIDLPKKIENVQIRLISTEEGVLKQNESKSRIYVNMVGWVDKQNAEFLFFIFSNGFEHQYNYTINYQYNQKQKKFELTKVQFKGPPFD